MGGFQIWSQNLNRVTFNLFGKKSKIAKSGISPVFNSFFSHLHLEMHLRTIFVIKRKLITYLLVSNDVTYSHDEWTMVTDPQVVRPLAGGLQSTGGPPAGLAHPLF